jgi:hypothetical protein
MPRPTRPMRPVSDAKLKAAGGWLASTFTPKVSSAGRPRATHSEFLPAAAELIEDRSSRDYGYRVCEIQLSEACQWRASQKSHRITQKSGGRHGAAKERSDRPSNVLDACGYCHHVITVTPWKVDAHASGWVLREWQEPSQEPVLYRGDLVYLTDGGDVVSFEKAGA